MTHKERFTRALECKPIEGKVPHFELDFFLTMEAFGKVNPSHRSYYQWGQMSYAEKKMHIEDTADLYIDVAKKYDHSAIFVHPNPGDFENTKWLLETIREKVGDEYYLTAHNDPTFEIPDGDNMIDFSVKMYDEPEELHEEAKVLLEESLEFARKINDNGHLLDGFALCSDYALNVNPFFTPDMFEEFIVPYLAEIIKEQRAMNFHSIKHSDGNIMPILKQIADCKPDAIHSLDPQGGVSIPEVRKIIGEDICLIGNVNCALLQTGTKEECEEDVKRSLREGMERGYGYIFSTSNCVYTGMPLERYEMLVDIWNKYGIYGK